MMITLRQLVEDQKRLSLRWYYGEALADTIELFGETASNVVGYYNMLHPDRLQVLGQEEYDALVDLDEIELMQHIQFLKYSQAPALLLCDDLAPSKALSDACRQTKLPLLMCAQDSAQVIDALLVYMARQLSPILAVHGVFLDVLGLGVLITGDSGLGKSELALELISRGHGLVADDIVYCTRPAPNRIEGSCPDMLSNLLEVRGLGPLDIRTIFGETSVRRRMPIKLVVHLVKASDQPMPRLPDPNDVQTILDVPIPRIQLTVAPGRNLAVLVEAAVRQTILKLRGIDTLAEFKQRQADIIASYASQDE